MAITDMRREYSAASLQRADLLADPIAQFNRWFAEAQKKSSTEANVMTLATADKKGKPLARIILLKGLETRGFIFFSHYDGPKGRDLTDNPQAALVFFWPELERQVCVNGSVSKLSAAESDKYFHSRPRGSQLAAWVSKQSVVVPDRKFLEEKLRAVETKFTGDVPRPDYWGGYVLAPDCIEFWQGRPNRLHDRFSYSKQADGSWKIERLAP